MHIEETVLPVSGLQVQWRPDDDHFRIRPPGHDDTLIASEKLAWRPWSGHSDMAVGTSGPLAEETPSMWWAVWGEYTGTDVLVTLDDLSHPPVMIFGKLWLTEWCGPEQEVIVVSGGRQAEVQFATPPDPPTGHPEDRSEDWHCVEAPAGFHDIPRLRTP